MILQLLQNNKNLQYWNFESIPLRIRVKLAWRILLGKNSAIDLGKDTSVRFVPVEKEMGES